MPANYANGDPSRNIIACALCHGPDLNGIVLISEIAAQSPSYMARQRNNMNRGSRKGGMAAIMTPIVANLAPEDILNIVAYTAFLSDPVPEYDWKSRSRRALETTLLFELNQHFAKIRVAYVFRTVGGRHCGVTRQVGMDLISHNVETNRFPCLDLYRVEVLVLWPSNLERGSFHNFDQVI
ncbi:MAG: hypothetical protein CMI18_04540 [Opitutaceae bacterium]|nr:hypothetical protein [Opitutaceae bacterium]